MYDLLFVNVVKSLTDLANDRTGVCFLHSVVLSEQLQQLPARAVLNQQVHVFLVLEETIKRCDVTVVEEELDAEFSCDLVDVLFFTDLLLRHYLHAAEETCFLVLDEHHLSELALAHFLADCEVRFFELFSSGRLFNFHLDLEGLLHSFDGEKAFNWFGHLRFIDYWLGGDNGFSFEGLGMRGSFWRKHEGLRRKVVGFDWLIAEIRIFLLEHPSFSLHWIISERDGWLLRLRFNAKLPHSIRRVSSIRTLRSFCVISKERFTTRCFCDGISTGSVNGYLWLFLLKEGNRTWIHCRFPTRKLEVWLGVAFRLLAHRILHSFIEKLQLLLDRCYFPLALVLHRFVRELFLKGLDWLLLGEQGVELAGAKWRRVGLGHIEARETVDVFTVIILENEGGGEFSLFVVGLKGEIARLGGGESRGRLLCAMVDRISVLLDGSAHRLQSAQAKPRSFEVRGRCRGLDGGGIDIPIAHAALRTEKALIGVLRLQERIRSLRPSVGVELVVVLVVRLIVGIHENDLIDKTKSDRSIKICIGWVNKVKRYQWWFCRD